LKLFLTYLAIFVLASGSTWIVSKDLLESMLPTIAILGTVIVAPWIIILTALRRDLRDEERSSRND